MAEVFQINQTYFNVLLHEGFCFCFKHTLYCEVLLVSTQKHKIEDEEMECEDAEYRVFVPLYDVYDEYKQSVKNDVGESSIFTRNSQLTKLLEFCMQPKTKNDTEAILMDFWYKFGKSDDVKRGITGDWGEIVASSIFSLDYVYNKTEASLSSVKRSLYIENEVRALYRKRRLFSACNFFVWKLLRRNTDF